MNLIALRADSTPAKGLKRLKNTPAKRLAMRCTWLLLPLILTACATPQPPAPKAVYDFGPVLSSASAAAPTRSAAVALPEIEASASLDSPSLLYRLQYSNAQQLLPYAQARWSSSPAQLVRARVRDALALQGPVLSTEGIAPWVLRIELDEFSQVFESPEKSFGLVRLRVSLLKNDQLAAQTTVLARAPAASQDAAGGVKALTAATDDAVRQLSSWLAAQIKYSVAR
ncbi:ABC-type transport auxiliary lipoprotein family protein [Variovorax sp. PCZ-1]|uniref:ABC-type transport auxiliary lipoprotein family protein n=1 Tax=Variovorax sp. PCZ-1 TaxID=2835533 RepID=UPI001BD1770E|nr:ABC-type transport auxiliary lipoprotein family protein [Variovorax sp. PCZ-1]MBS7809121.1 membrane integrity-associated transporter subunit PqiC [Variovorax sp. PCZ-1]